MIVTRTAGAAALLAGLVIGSLAVATDSASAAPASTCGGGAGAAFRGIHQVPDIVVGEPGFDVNGQRDAGSILTQPLCGTGPTQYVHLPTPHFADRFGTSSTYVNVNGDAYDDLVVGVPYYNVGRLSDAGAVAIFYGSSRGLVFHTLLTQDSPGVPGVAQARAHFGAVVTSADPFAVGAAEFPEQDIRIGEPGLDLGAATDAGGVVDLRYTGKGVLSTSGTRELTLNSPGVPGTAQRGDQLGASLWRTSVIGAPGRTVHGHPGAGAVLYTPTVGRDRLVTQDSPCVSGVPETNDHFGAAVSTDWIGVPGEDLGRARDAGMVERYDPAQPDHRAQCFALSAASKGFTGLHAGDRFGAALSELPAYYDGVDAPTLLLVGAPGTNVGRYADAGTVDWIRENIDAENGYETLGAAGHTAGSHPGTHAALGTAFADSLAVASAPGADRGLGRVDEFGTNGHTLSGVVRSFAPAADGHQVGTYGASLASAAS